MIKNIHILPTNKSSRLSINCQTNLLQLGLENRMFHDNLNIYITSDEEIKEGDWFLDDNNQISHSYRLSHVKFANPKKIILTTDQDLIKDGVQAINDEFLDWFVKNPSCEKVEVINEQYTQNYHKDIWYNKYKIIIPKEEPKQEHCDNCNNKICCCIIRKQETLEEAAWRVFGKNKDNFYDGAKWQQERSFSNEEVLELLKNFYQDNNFNGTITEWFEQFKKK